MVSAGAHRSHTSAGSNEDRHRQTPAGGPVVGVIVGVDECIGPIVGAHCSDRVVGAQRCQVVGADVVEDAARRAGPRVEEVPEEHVGGGADHPCGEVAGLGQEGEMEGEDGADTSHRLPQLNRRDHTDHTEVTDPIRVVERQPEGDEAAAVMTDDRELVGVELVEHTDHVGSHRPLAVHLRTARRLVARPVATKIDAHHPMVRGQRRGDMTPGQQMLGEPVQQHDHRTASRR